MKPSQLAAHASLIARRDDTDESVVVICCDLCEEDNEEDEAVTLWEHDVVDLRQALIAWDKHAKAKHSS